MSSNRKPLSETTRHMTVAERQEKQQAEDMISSVSNQEILKPPSWLSKVAKEEWKRILPQLLSIDIVGNLDLANIAGYCQAYSNYRRATEALNASNLVIASINSYISNINKNDINEDSRKLIKDLLQEIKTLSPKYKLISILIKIKLLFV